MAAVRVYAPDTITPQVESTNFAPTENAERVLNDVSTLSAPSILLHLCCCPQLLSLPEETKVVFSTATMLKLHGSRKFGGRVFQRASSRLPQS
jgi:hypothetical protein